MTDTVTSLMKYIKHLEETVSIQKEEIQQLKELQLGYDDSIPKLPYLTQREYQMFRLLYRYRDEIITFDGVYDAFTWREEQPCNRSYTKHIIWCLRTKLKQYNAPYYILTIPSRGYVLRCHNSSSNEHLDDSGINISHMQNEILRVRNGTR